MELFDTLEKLETPIQTTHTFVGGSLDGKQKQATVHYVLTDKVIVTINNEHYRYMGDDRFQFIGVVSKMKDVKETPLQKLKAGFLKWLLT